MQSAMTPITDTFIGNWNEHVQKLANAIAKRDYWHELPEYTRFSVYEEFKSYGVDVFAYRQDLAVFSVARLDEEVDLNVARNEWTCIRGRNVVQIL